jgi:CheY-like chemotaxis protein
MQSLRVLLVDDNLAFLDLAARELAADARVQIVGHAQSAEDALAQVQQAQPDLVLLDIALPGMNGLEATRQIGNVAPRAKVLVITASRNERLLQQVLDAGAAVPAEEAHEQLRCPRQRRRDVLLDQRAGVGQRPAGRSGLGLALFGQVDVVPAGEQVLHVPDALSVANENQFTGHAGLS